MPKSQKKMTKNSLSKKTLRPKKSQQIFVTQEMMFEFRGEVISYLKSHDNLHKEHTKRFESIDRRFDALESKMDSKFAQLEAKFDSKFAEVDSKFAQLEAKFDSKFDRMMSEMHRIGLLVEEQNARNKFVLDGYASIVDRLDKHDTEIAEIKNIIEKI